jgi:hypothetical protein
VRASLELGEPVSRHPALRVSSGASSKTRDGMVSPASLRPAGSRLYRAHCTRHQQRQVTFSMLAYEARVPYGRSWYKRNEVPQPTSPRRPCSARPAAVGSPESLGYQMDKRESSRGSTVLRRGGDKIVVTRNHNGHYVFFSVRDDRDNGTIIDFVQRRENLSLGEVRKILRPWIGRAALPVFSRLEPTSKDRMRVEREYRRMAEAPRHPYLEYRRCIPAGISFSKLSF